MPREIIWELEQHTKAKHDILKRYLQAWFPILSRYNKRIVYIDGFAGPGIYKHGEDGSPIIAINTAKDHFMNLQSEIVFWFIEENERRCKHLKSILDEMDVPDNFNLQVECSAFDRSLTSTLKDIDEQGKRLAPTFAFIDPFGLSDTPFSIVQNIMKNEKCEVFITFMSGFLNRFKDHEYNDKHISDLLGTENWKELKENWDEESFVEFYQEQLSKVAKYVRSFTMVNQNGQVIYRLIFGTNNYRGLQKMKGAMWKVDETGSFRYSDSTSTDPNQRLLFTRKPNFDHLKKLIVSRFDGKCVSVDEIEEYVVVNTPYRETHFKTQILAPMEKADPPQIDVTRLTKSKRGYPSGTQISFLGGYDLIDDTYEITIKSKESKSTKQRTLTRFDC